MCYFDLHMPVLDGWGATQQIKAAPEMADIPVLAVTADAVIHRTPERVREIGFCGCLGKPCTPSVLREVVRGRSGPSGCPGSKTTASTSSTVRTGPWE